MVGRTKYAIPSIDSLKKVYNVELLQKKKNMRQEITKLNSNLEGRMTVEDCKIR